jgi:hypothetical protein
MQQHLRRAVVEYYAAHPEVEASAAARMLARTLPAAGELAASHLLDGTGPSSMSEGEPGP